MKKKLISIALLLIMVLALTPGLVSAQTYLFQVDTNHRQCVYQSRWHHAG